MQGRNEDASLGWAPGGPETGCLSPAAEGGGEEEHVTLGELGHPLWGLGPPPENGCGSGGEDLPARAF